MSVAAESHSRSTICTRLPLACLALAIGLTIWATPALGAPSLLRSAGGFRLSGNYTNTETIPNLETALTLARTHALLVISQGWQLGFEGSWDGTVSDTYFDEMMAANPRLLIFRYLNAMYDPGRAFPESWYLHNAAGHRLFNPTYGNYLMDPRSTEAYTEEDVTSQGWVQYLEYLFRKDVARFPGVFNGGIWLDDVGGRPHVIDVVTSQPSEPVDQSGRRWTDATWEAMTTSVTARLQSETQRLVFANALLSGNCYFTGCGGDVPTGSFLSAPGVDGAMAEAWLTAWYNSTARMPSILGWRQDVQMVIDANRRGRSVQLMTAPPALASTRQIDRWRLYAYSSFLLANSGRSYFQFAPNCRPNCGGPTRTGTFEMADPLYSIDIGTPVQNARSINAYKRARGRYFVRRYSKGKVWVNPTRRAVRIYLGRRYRLSDGRVVRWLVLRPASGQIGIAQAPDRRPHRRKKHRRP